MADFEFSVQGGSSGRLHDASRFGLTVIAFTSTSCPLSRKYLPTLVQLHRDFAPRG
ncbi:MAG UNVERIFIED_CONTAM: hypothetical protein LVR18_11485 [Planctomycetaceae bacterium]